MTHNQISPGRAGGQQRGNTADSIVERAEKYAAFLSSG